MNVPDMRLKMPSFDFCGLFVAFIFNSSKSKGLPCGAARKAVCWAARVCLLLLNPCFSHRFGTPCFQWNVTRITSVKRHCQHFYLVQPTFRSLKLAQKAIFFCDPLLLSGLAHGFCFGQLYDLTALSAAKIPVVPSLTPAPFVHSRGHGRSVCPVAVALLCFPLFAHCVSCFCKS